MKKLSARALNQSYQSLQQQVQQARNPQQKSELKN
ncbi:LtrC-like protein, partial [Lactiplantibacillus plantarum]|nr:LtrC-like protein [Lactiplantibacillus plantarum]MCZ9397574.1 LtrC-like protein [Lactiplantibacillus plantarum]